MDALYNRTDVPADSGPFWYSLTVWPAGGAGAGTDAVSSKSTVWAGPVFPGSGGERAVPDGLRLTAAPVPWSGRGAMRFILSQALPRDGRLRILSAGGAEVASLSWPAGAASVAWDGQNRHGRLVASGAYLCRLEAGKAIVGGIFFLLR